MNYIKDITAYFERLKNAIDQIDKSELNNLMNVLVEAKESGKQIFIMGNGGSSATASHYVCDFNKGVSLGQEKKFKFICLNDNIPSLMAYAKGHFRVGDSLVFVPVCESCAEKSEESGFGSMTWFPEVIIA